MIRLSQGTVRNMAYIRLQSKQMIFVFGNQYSAAKNASDRKKKADVLLRLGLFPSNIGINKPDTTEHTWTPDSVPYCPR